MEKKQLFYIITSVGLALILFIVGALWLVSSKKQTPGSLAAIQNSTTDSQEAVSNKTPGAITDTEVNPTEWVKNPQTIPGIQPPPVGTASNRGDVIIVYGDNTVTSKTTDTLQPSDTDPNRIVIQVPSTQSTGTPLGTAAETEPQKQSTQPGQAAKTSVPAQPKEVPAKAVKTTAPVQKPAPSGSKTAVKASTPKSYTDYWVQTGAYSSKTRAETVRDELKAKGITAILDVKDINGKTYYRVRIGPYTSQKEAQYWLSLVKNLDGFSESYISMVQAKR